MKHRNIIDKKRIKEILTETFANDVNQRKYFISENYETGVDDTYLQNITVIDNNNAEFYELIDNDDKLLGFINVLPEVKMLYSFGLKHSERTAENKKKFIATIDELLPFDQIICSLYTKNERGIRFLENNGFEKGKIVTLIKNKK